MSNITKSNKTIDKNQH